MDEIRFIYVLGYGWSGSSVVVDYLREFDDFIVPDVEFRVIKERYGLMNLEISMTDQYDPLETDLAVKDFLWLMDKLNTSHKRFSLKRGLEYEKRFGDHFLKAVNSFIDKLVKYRFDSSWWFFIWKLSNVKWLYYKIMKKLKIKEYKEKMFFCMPVSKDKFRKYSKTFILDIFKPLVKDSNCHNVILDQGVPAHLPQYAFYYTPNSKVIIVDRDPRDMYVDLVNSGELIGVELAKNDDAQMFVDWFKAFHDDVALNDSENVMFVNFEEFVENYEKVDRLITNFLHISPSTHKERQRFFNPNVSKKNVGIWKSYKNQAVMKNIADMLPDYCYSFD